ncbi:phosphatidylserine decarboxylase [Bacillus alkalisoli]|uniref:phosphatidylserine decarboxylase n=1 Tax=Bacillus alkalisoli TaxID=2011008 RepID=UPI000C23DE74|nr:phosphatidylserine decarboxylase [Bacillus alkalisoli]
MSQKLYRTMIELTNHKLSSNIIKNFSQSKLSKLVVPSFAKTYKINIKEMKEPIQSYPTLQKFFIRTLKPGARPIDQAKDSVVSPVDAVLEKFGTITDNLEMIVKEKKYSIQDMLEDKNVAEKYMGGTFMLLYLSPSHYHRIHSPITGEVANQWTLGKNKSYPVNRLGLKYGKDTLSKNYRKVTEMVHDQKHVAIVKVGAMFVNSIELTHEGTSLKKGQEMAYFSFGSTVILLFEKDAFTIDKDLTDKADVFVGQRIGKWN